MKTSLPIAGVLIAVASAVAVPAHATVYTVTSASDSKKGFEAPTNTLRGAIYAAMASPNTKDTIRFKLKRPVIRINPSLGSFFVGSQISPNPNKKIIIDGFSQKKGKVPPVIINARGVESPFLFKTGNHVLRGFQIFNYKGAGVFIDGGGNGDGGNAKVRVEKNWIGFSKNQAGKITTNNSIRDHGYGVIIYGSNNTITQNVISGVHNGINIGYDPATSASGITQQSNVISKNLIGTSPDGKNRIGNTSDGIFMGSLAQNNTIIGNTISGQESAGIEMLSKTTTGNIVIGNFIGTDKAGKKVIGNGDNGVHMAAYATNNRVGGTSAAERNVISGNKLTGVLISSTPLVPGKSMTNKVQGNYIGCDATGSVSLGNQNIGVFCEQAGSLFNEVSGNVIGGNLQWGVYAVKCWSNKFLNNRIGIGPNGQHIGNPRGGMVLDSGGNHTVTGNNIQWNGYAPNGADYAPNGVRQYNGSSGNTISGNTITNNRVN